MYENQNEQRAKRLFVMPAQLGDDDFCRCHLVNHPVCLIDIGISTLIVDRNYRAVLAHTDRAVVLGKGLLVMDGASSDLVPDHEALALMLGVYA